MTGADFLAKNKDYLAKAKLLKVLGPCWPGTNKISQGRDFLSLPWNLDFRNRD